VVDLRVADYISSTGIVPTPAYPTCSAFTPTRPTDNDADNDVSDVGSLASAHASTTTSTTPSATSSPRMTLSQPAHAPLGSPVAPALPSAARRALNRGRMDEISGEGSQSEGQDSGTYVTS
jgi:choline-phosphate cytidylyltransferase